MAKLHVIKSTLLGLAAVVIGEAKRSLLQNLLPLLRATFGHGARVRDVAAPSRLHYPSGYALASFWLLVMLAGLLASPVAQAQNQPWCSVSSGATSCLYASPSECEQSIQAIGGHCIPNPYGVTPDQNASGGASVDDGMPPPPGMESASDWMPYCSVTDGGTSCVYSDPASCEQIVQPEGGYCMPNPRRR